jgi:hypothetical protein
LPFGRGSDHALHSTAAIKNLKALAAPIAQAAKGTKTVSAKTQLGDCCICLFPVTIRQALFITPCSHTFHYKCLRPLLESHHPGFSCPLCRTFADLEEDVEIDAPDVDIDMDSPSPSEHEGGPNGEDSEMEAIGADLAPPPRETGAETEVEGEAIRRNPTPSNNPFADSPVPVEEAEEGNQVEHMLIVDTPEPAGSSANAIVDELGASGMEDIDGTVGGKRKR